MTPELIAEVRAALATLDLSAEREALAQLEAELADIVAAQRRAIEQRDLIHGQLQTAERKDANSLATAFIEGAVEVLPDTGTLRHNLNAINGALSELARRKSQAESALRPPREAAGRKLAAAFEPMRAEAERLAQAAFADMETAHALNRALAQVGAHSGNLEHDMAEIRSVSLRVLRRGAYRTKVPSLLAELIPDVDALGPLIERTLWQEVYV